MSVKITIVGLGPGRAEYLSMGALAALQKAGRVLLRTAQHPIVAQLPALDIKYESLDWVYESGLELEEVYSRLAEEVIKAGREAGGTVVYAVPGHPLVAEASVRALLDRAEKEDIELEVAPSLSAVEVCILRLGLDPLQGGLRLADAQNPYHIDAGTATLFLQLDSRLAASDLKVSLLEEFPPEHEVVLLRSIGVSDEEKMERTALVELDRRDDFTHLTSLFVPALSEESRRVSLQDLVDLMARLRSADGCPWDREQDHHSLRPCLEEETREVLEAIEKEDPKALCEELGDLFLQVLFHARLAAEAGEFNMEDILRGLRDKLIERHPHVFGGEKIATAAEVLEAWEELKQKERSTKQTSPAPPDAAKNNVIRKGK